MKMKEAEAYFVLALCLVLHSSSTLSDNPVNSNNSLIGKAHIIVVVPTTSKEHEYCNGSQAKWERGEEILPGAEMAVNAVTNDIKLPYKLEIISIKVPQCKASERIDRFVDALTNKTLNPVAVIGYFCDNLAHTMSQLAQHQTFGVIQISATLPLRPLASNKNSTELPQIHNILPSSAYCARAAADLIQMLGWRRIGVIGKGFYHDTHFSRMKEHFLVSAKKRNIMAVFQTEWSTFNTPSGILNELRQSTAKVVVVFLPPSDVADIVCQAYLNDMIWPNYVWVYVEINSIEIINTIEQCSVKPMIVAMEKAVFVHRQMWQIRKMDDISITNEKTPKESSNPKCHKSNPYADVLNDSVRAIAFALDRLKHLHPSTVNNRIYQRVRLERELANISFEGVTGFVNFSQHEFAVEIPVDLIQIQNGHETIIGEYSVSSNILILNKSKLGDIPDDDLENVYLLYPRYLSAILLAFMTLSLLFTTVIMSLYIHYRKNPEIKATSSILSLCMFVGCYCLIISSLIHTIDSGLVIKSHIIRYTVCWGVTFLFTVGIDMVLTTVFTKAIRIYYIFNDKSLRRLNPIWSDKYLFVVILTVVLVKVLMMIIWASVDINHLIDVRNLSFETTPPHYMVIQKCESQYLGVWVGCTLGYTAFLFLPMITAAILTRKIRGERFKDSKKICALVAVLFVLICTGCTLWFFLRQKGENIASKVVYSLGFTLAALACQVFLFLPKIIPSVQRHADILKPTWVDTSISTSGDFYTNSHHYHRLY